MHSYLAKTLKENQCPTLLVAEFPITYIVSSSYRRTIQSPVSCGHQAQFIKVVKTQAAGLGKFHWQEGYGSFSVSQSHIDQVQKYLLNQQTHHRRKLFRTSFVSFEDIRLFRRAIRVGLRPFEPFQGSKDSDVTRHPACYAGLSYLTPSAYSAAVPNVELASGR